MREGGRREMLRQEHGSVTSRPFSKLLTILLFISQKNCSFKKNIDIKNDNLTRHVPGCPVDDNFTRLVSGCPVVRPQLPHLQIHRPGNKKPQQHIVGYKVGQGGRGGERGERGKGWWRRSTTLIHLSYYIISSSHRIGVFGYALPPPLPFTSQLDWDSLKGYRGKGN